MENLFTSILTAGEALFHFSWLPLFIWTVAALTGWLIMRTYTNLHPQIQYHGRLALMFALPAGFAGLATLYLLENTLFANQAEPVSLKIISMVNPIEISVTENSAPSIYTLPNILMASLFLMLISGALFSLFRFIFQWLQLIKIRSSFHFKPILELNQLDQKNRKLASGLKKSVDIAFHSEEIVPVTFGYRHPVILLPESLQNYPDKLNLAIRHELTHITQNDFISQVTTVCTGIFFWFHPVVHMLKKELIEYRELRCDSLVLSEDQISRKEYASLLLELLHMPNLNKELSVNMAQESSNLKKRILMITQPDIHKPIPKRLSLAIFGAVILSTAVFMACTDMQTSQIFDEEELELMTDIDRDGSRGYHQILIFMSDEEQAARHMEALEQLQAAESRSIQSINVLKGQNAIDKYGDRGEDGVLEVNTLLSEEAYNSVLRTLGMETQELNLSDPYENEDYFVVVEEMPELIGGLRQLQTQIRYPEMARRAGIQGRVFIQFIVDEQGDVIHPRVIRGIGGGADEEALRVVRQAKFTPGIQRGQPVRVQYSLPIYFRLPESANSNPSVIEIQPDASTTVEDPTVIERRMTVQFNQNSDRISGRVLDLETRQPLAGTNVIVNGSNIGSTTDADGNFQLSNIDTENITLQFSYIGYETAQLEL